MTIKQFKRRWLNSKIEPELFYMPVKKKEKRADYIILSFKELFCVNYYEVLEDYPEYTDKITSQYKKYSTTLRVGGNSEVIFYNENYIPLFKMPITNNFTLYNIPYGTYYIKIIKGSGYTLREFTIEVTENSNKQTFILEVTRSYVKVELGMDEGENTSTIREHNSYKESDKVSPWLFDHCLYCNVSGRMYYKYYTYDNKYLGKAVIGHSIYDTDWVGNHETYYYFKYCPTNLIEEHITGNYTFGQYDYRGKSIVKDFSYSTYHIGYDDYINMPILDKNYNCTLTTEITYTPNRSFIPERTYKGSSGVSYNTTAFKYQYECYVDDEFVGYNLYFEDNMTKEIHNLLVSGCAKENRNAPKYLLINTNTNTVSSTELIYVYDKCKSSDENTIYYYHSYPLFSDDYDDYNSLKEYYSSYTFL